MSARPRSDFCDPSRLKLLVEDQLSADELVELEDHLEGCSRCREMLDDIVQSDAWVDVVRQRVETGFFESGETSSTRSEVLHFLSPSDWPDSIGRLGTYEVKGMLGRGGMGIVLKAFDPVLSRTVAIKVMAAGLAACGASRQRFLREARAAAAVVHEHVVAVHAVEESAGLPYLVMEYVPGLSLQERIDRVGPSSLTEVLRIGMQTASGLAAAHAQGLVHRDVKPANILLENNVERVRLTDFGLARAVADAGMTHSGVIAGTPHYMAPEQANGQTTDHRADLFSLGSTLYAACAGFPPFQAESPLAVLRRVCDEFPRPLREINPNVPPWLEQLIARLMAKEPTKRYQTAAEAANLLGGCLAHVQQPTLFPLPCELQLDPKPHLLQRRLFLKVAGVALIGVAVLALVTGSLGNLRTATKEATTGARQQTASARVAAPVTQSIQGPQTDEIQALVQELQNGTAYLEASLHRQDTQASFDSLTDETVRTFQSAEALERELLFNRTAVTVPNGSFPNPNSRDRR